MDIQLCAHELCIRNYVFSKTRSSDLILWEAISSSLFIIYQYIHIYNRLIGLVGRVFANGPGDLGSNPGRVIPKILKMVFDTSLLNTQQYKVGIKGKVEQSRERSRRRLINSLEAVCLSISPSPLLSLFLSLSQNIYVYIHSVSFNNSLSHYIYIYM